MALSWMSSEKSLPRRTGPNMHRHQVPTNSEATRSSMSRQRPSKHSAWTCIKPGMLMNIMLRIIIKVKKQAEKAMNTANV